VTEPEPLAEAAAPSEPPRRRAGVLVVALAVVVGLLAASSVVLALYLRSERADRDDFAKARSSATNAAGQLLVNLDALSAATIDRDMKRVVEGSTGTFRKQFTSSQQQLKAYILKQKITSSGELRSVAILRSDTDTATALVAIDRTFKDAAHPQGVVANDRWKVSLEKHGGRWLAANLEPVA
jgi:Mce-associated membrane protein